MKNIRDIIPDREIIKHRNMKFAGREYECWKVSTPVWADQVESLLENGYMVSMLEDGIVTIDRQLNASPEDISSNKNFWRKLSQTLGVDRQ